MAKKRKAVAVLSADQRRFQKELRRAQGNFKRFSRSIRANLKRAFSGFTALSGLGAGFGIASLGRDVLQFEDRLQRVASQARFTEKGLNGLRSQIDGISDATGLARDELLGGVEAIVDTGGKTALTEGRIKALKLGMLGAGSEAKSLADLMFALGENAGVADDEMTGAISAMDKIGTVKSIPLAELSAEMAAVTSNAKLFQVRGVRGVAQLTASMQILRTAFKGTSEVATGLDGAMKGIQRKEKVLEKMGVDVRDANGEFRPLVDLVNDIANNKQIQRKGLINVIGRAEGSKAIRVIAENIKEINELTEAGVGNQNFLNVRAGERQRSRAGRMQKQFNRMRQAIAKAFTPERLEKFARIMDKVATIIEKIVDNPGKALAIGGALKIGPALVGSLAPLIGSAIGKSTLGVATSVLGTGARTMTTIFRSAGLVTAAGAVGFALGRLALKIPGVTEAMEKVGDVAFDLFGSDTTDIATGGVNTVAGIQRELDAERISQGEAEKRRARLAQSFSRRGVNPLIGKVVEDLTAQGAVTGDEARARIAARQARVQALASQAVREGIAGKDTAATLDKLADVIAGQDVVLKLDGKEVARSVRNSILEGLQ